MKKTDIAMIILIASVSVIVAFFVAENIFGTTYNGNVKFKTIDVINSNVEEPSPDVFNSNAINPAVQVQIDGTQ
jgi:hypothetical protein